MSAPAPIADLTSAAPLVRVSQLVHTCHSMSHGVDKTYDLSAPWVVRGGELLELVRYEWLSGCQVYAPRLGDGRRDARQCSISEVHTYRACEHGTYLWFQLPTSAERADQLGCLRMN